MTSIYVFDGATVRAVEAPAARPLRWAAWRPDGAHALLAGNRGQALLFDGERFRALATESTHNLRGAAWSPDGRQALLVGNRGAVLLFDGKRFAELPPVTAENLRRADWSPDGSCALIAGNGGCVLRFDAATRAMVQLPGDRAHTLRSIAWRSDGAYALIGGYASRHAGYPRPHCLYRCDGRYTQALLTTDDEDDAIAIEWQPHAASPRALVLVASYAADGSVSNKVITYLGWGLRSRQLDAGPALLGAGWHPGGEWALFCGESGRMLRDDGDGITPIASGVRDNLVGPFWRPDAASTIALMLKGPDEKIYTV